MGVAVEVHGHREGGDVRRVALDVYRQCRLRSAVARRADAGRVDLLQKLPLQLRQLRVRVGLAAPTSPKTSSKKGMG